MKKFNELPLDEIKKRIRKSIEEFKKNDGDILYKNKVHESAMGHRIAVYFEKEFKEGNIDCEYNKILSNSKINKEGKGVRPDIIIHKRGEEGGNLVVVEIKKCGKSSKKAKKDIQKIKNMSNLNYEAGLFIGILKNKIVLCWIKKDKKAKKDRLCIEKNGEIIKRNTNML